MKTRLHRSPHLLPLLFLVFVYFVAFYMDKLFSPPPPSFPPPPSSINALVTEIDDFEFYHHPSWPEKWSHPEFETAREDDWGSAPWLEQTKNRYTTRFLSLMLESTFPWGYIIYRTVYTPESDEQWPLALKKLDAALDRGIDLGLNAESKRSANGVEPDSTPERLLKESRRHVVFSDKDSWDGASVERIRVHFKEYLAASKGRGYGRFEGCLVIDKRSLKSIIAASNPRPRLGEGFVGMVDGRYPEETGPGRGADPGYKGFMRVFISSLWFFYGESGNTRMMNLCPKGVPGHLIPVYDEGTGTAHDEEGNKVEVYLTEGRNRGRRVF
ncbi:hypothetical protein BJX76DRAFT_352238 [Aspergillus varians]